MSRCKNPRGLTLLEAMILMVILSIVAVAAGVGIQAVAKVPAQADNTLAVNDVVVSVMEQTRASVLRTWPSSTWGGSSYAFTANATGYTHTAGTTIGASPGAAAGYSTPLSGSSPVPLSINN